MQQNPSIIFLVRLYHPHIGGVEKHVKTLSHLLSERGYRVTIITEKYDSDLKSFERIEGISVYRIDVGKSYALKNPG